MTLDNNIHIDVKFNQKEINDIVEDAKDDMVKAFLVDYAHKHRYCPDCGKTDLAMPLNVSYVVGTAQLHSYRNTSKAYCPNCYFLGCVHDLLAHSIIEEFLDLYTEFSKMREHRIPTKCEYHLEKLIELEKDEALLVALKRQQRMNRYIDLRVKLCPLFFTSLVNYANKGDIT